MSTGIDCVDGVEVVTGEEEFESEVLDLQNIVSKSKNFHSIYDVNDVEDCTVDSQRQLKHLAHLYRAKQVFPISEYSSFHRVYEFTFKDGISIDTFGRTPMLEQKVAKPKANDRNLSNTKCVQYLAPIQIEGYTNILDEEELRPRTARDEARFLVGAINTYDAYLNYCRNMQPHAVNHVEFQNLNPHHYMNMEGATDRLRHKLAKTDPSLELNPEQREAYDGIMEFFHRKIEPLPAAAIPNHQKLIYERRMAQRKNAAKLLLKDLQKFTEKYQTSGVANSPDGPGGLRATPEVQSDLDSGFSDDLDERNTREYKLRAMYSSDDLTAIFDEPKISAPAVRPQLEPLDEVFVEMAKLQGLDLSCNERMPSSPELEAAPGPSYGADKRRPDDANVQPPKKSRLESCPPYSDATGETLDWGIDDDDLFLQTHSDIECLDIGDESPTGLPNCLDDYSAGEGPEADVEEVAPTYPSLLEVFLIKGSAGTGKTFIMDALNFALPVLYTTIKGTLVQDVVANYDAAGSTLCKVMCSLFKLNFYDYLSLSTSIERLPIHVVDEFVDKIDFGAYPFNLEMFKPTLCLFLDEYSMLSASMFRFFYKSLEKIFRERTVNRRMLIVLAGDRNQIQPIKAIYKDNCGRIESVCSKKFQLTLSKRMTDPTLIAMLKDLLVAKDVKEFLFKTFPTQCNNSTYVDFQYPAHLLEGYPHVYHVLDENTRKNAAAENATLGADMMLNYPKRNPGPAWSKFSVQTKNTRSSLFTGRIENIHLLMEWWRANKRQFNDTVLLSKTNAAVHRLNLEVFLKCRHDITEYMAGHAMDLDRTAFVRFSRIYHKHHNWVFKKTMGGAVRPNMYILPLIVGMQYIVMTTMDNLRHGDLVYLLGFLDTPNQGLIMASERDQIFILYPATFEMRLFKDQQLFGFPLCMGASINIYNSQGKTFKHKKVYIDMQNCSRNEMFVALSRPRRMNQICNMFV